MQNKMDAKKLKQLIAYFEVLADIERSLEKDDTL